MKASTRYNILFYVGAMFGYLGLFPTSIGLPDWVGIPFFLIFVTSVCIVAWLRRRAKRRGDPTFVQATHPQNRRYTSLLLIVLFVSCVAWPFVLPYTGAKAPFSELAIISALIFIVVAPLIIIVRRRREKA
jgi:hypothetical protein